MNLKEKIYKPIFAKRISPKYLENLQMVLSMLCNGEKTCKKFELFRCKYIRKSYCLIQFFSAKEPAKILGKLSSVSVSYQLSLVLLKDHWVFCKDRKQDCLSHLMSTEQILKKLLTSFHQKKFVRSSFSNPFLYQTTWVNYFESCKESKLVNSVLSKGDLSFAY